MKTSNFLSLNWYDFGKMFLIAFITFLLNWLQITFVPLLDVSPETRTLISGAIAYLSKNFFTPKSEAEKIIEQNNLIGGRPDDRK